jgi:S-(hydroxymethyl)glutathione dehydrogenase/alcohol dehydrogenase
MKAAVLRAYNAPLDIEQIQIDKPGPHEVLTRTVASGICHSDLHVIEGGIPMPVPCVLGHEPAGIVEAVGSDVTEVAVGDHVIGCLNAWCGNCEYCLTGRPHLCMPSLIRRAPQSQPRLSKNGEPIVQFALSSFAEHMLTHERALVKIPAPSPP